MGRRRGAGDAALDLRRRDPVGHGRKRLGRIVARLHFHRTPIDRRAIEPRRRSGLETTQRKSSGLEGFRKPERGRLTHPARWPALFAEVDQPAEKCPRRDNDRASPNFGAITETDADYPITRSQQLIGLTLDHREVGGLADRGLHRCRIKFAVGLGARSAHRRTLAAIEHPELNAAGVSRPAHQAIERIDLTDQMAFAEPADRRIARHRADGSKLMGDKRRSRAHACRCGRGFTAGVAASDHDDIERLDHGFCRSSDGATSSSGSRHSKGKSRSCFT